MNHPKYNIFSDPTATVYTFTSEGQKGAFQKSVIYTPTEKNPNIHNLGFGDLIYDDTKEEYYIDDTITNDNGDIRLVLSTVAATAYEFTNTYPEITLFFTGSDLRRTKVYKRAIMLNFEELSERFHIFGARYNAEGEIIDYPFDYNEDFDGFLIKKKAI